MTTEYDYERECKEIDEDISNCNKRGYKLMSEQIFELKRLIKDIERGSFSFTCPCPSCINIKNRIKEVLKNDN